MFSEYKFILVLVVSLIFFIVHFYSGKISRRQIEYLPAIGVITRINTDDDGNSWFYIDLNINGSTYTAQTDRYSVIPRDTAKGDTVQVKYHYTKNNKVLCYIEQSGFERVASFDTSNKPYFLYIAIALFVLFLLMLFKFILA